MKNFILFFGIWFSMCIFYVAFVLLFIAIPYAIASKISYINALSIIFNSGAYWIFFIIYGLVMLIYSGYIIEDKY